MDCDEETARIQCKPGIQFSHAKFIEDVMRVGMLGWLCNSLIHTHCLQHSTTDSFIVQYSLSVSLNKQVQRIS